MKKIILSILTICFTTGLLAQLDRSTPPSAGPAPQINIGEYKKFKLSNGLQVFVVEDNRLPFVAYSLNLEIDPILEGEAVGYVSMAGSLMRSGTTNRTKGEIDEAIDFIGATFNTFSDGMYARSLKKHSEELLEIMSDVVMNPSFQQEELDRSILRMRSALQANKSDAGSIAANVANVLRFGKNDPYGELVSEETLENITVDLLKDYHKTYFRPNVGYLVIVGDISLKEAKKQAKKHFGKWKKGDVPTHQYNDPAKYEQPKVAIANREGAKQSTINVTHTVNLTPGHPDAIKASLMNQILGGGSFNARLFQNLREDKAFTYGAYSRLSNDKRIGHFTASTEVRTSVTDSAVYEILHEMTRMRTELVSEEELDLMKNVLTGSFSRSLEDPQTVARFALNIERYNLPADYYRTYLEKVAAVTPQDIKAMANKYLHPDHVIILAVGEADKIRESLSKFSPTGEVVQYDFYGNVVTGPREVTDVNAVEVIERYLEAIGGHDAVNAVEDVKMHASFTIQGMQLNMITQQKAPNKLLVETLMGGNVVTKQVFDGVNGLIVSPMGEQRLEGEMLEEMKKASALFAEHALLKPDAEIELVGVENVEGMEAFRINVLSNGESTKSLYYCVESGLKLREVSTGMQGTVISVFMDYKEVNGVKFPSAMRQSAGPQTFDITIDSIEVNTGIDDEVFAL
ncbi:M16 family metallopeptidase [Alkalitalea saponilacus]|uniref:Predicted Zn-dependent peptidase n=1 Tax=Alkalitalea saponilacus TaxID=889453 RepID=A0A1T5HU01_9BACT|nr:pitrilysin family protein [Alkalitalea saponilacus]ASB49194.1 peptidase M16 [Alkalitalea saponilacus]SKC23980.1 Predicted Zn-dependent peptidase [Alkalitalea saponilacus]